MADASWTYLILVPWVHVACAGLLVGATFFVAFLLPGGNSEAEGEAPGSPYVRTRHRFKMLVHPMILLLLASGIYKAISHWHAYRLNMPLTHALFGLHLLLGVLIFTILLVMLARKQPRAGEKTWLRYTAILLLLTMLVASALEYAREHPKQQTIEKRG